MSSSRVNTTLTGADTAFDTCTAAITKSCAKRRPKPPPSNVVVTLTFSGGTPTTFAITMRFTPAAWVGAQMSTPDGVTDAVQFIGSMQACARYGASYTASRVVA